MLQSLVFIVLGFLMLGFGAEALVSGSSRLALTMGVKPLLVGLTIVAFGTSAPELAVSVESTLADLGALALGNVVGSNIANIGLILGITALINPIHIEVGLVRRQIPIVIACSLLLGGLLFDGRLALLDGIILCACLAAYLVYSYRDARFDETLDDDNDLGVPPAITGRQGGSAPLNILLIVAGFALLVIGSQVFVNNAIILARLIGVSEAIIGLTLVAVGTSIPELATSVLAASRNQSDIAIGNVVGSNVFNILCVMGIASLFGTISTSQFSLVDFSVMLAFAFILLPFARSSLTLNRWEGALLLLGYLAYMGYIALL